MQALIQRFRDSPIRTKFALVLATSFAFGSAIALLAVAASGAWLRVEAARADIAAYARLIAYNLAAPLAFNDARTAAEALGGLATRDDVTGAAAYLAAGSAASAGTPFARYGSLPPASIDPALRQWSVAYAEAPVVLD